MRPLWGWLARIAAMFRNKSDDLEFSAELESHLVLHTEENIRRGLPPAEARRRRIRP